MEATPLPSTGHQARKEVTMTFTTTHAVKFHGWTLPTGTEVSVTKVTLAHSGQQQSHAACSAPEFSKWGFSLPVSAFGSLAGVPLYRLNEATSCEELVA